eukprot:SAG31_NODE_3242_length_4504_cov_3.880817_3_plen_158_part_00
MCWHHRPCMPAQSPAQCVVRSSTAAAVQESYMPSKAMGRMANRWNRPGHLSALGFVWGTSMTPWQRATSTKRKLSMLAMLCSSARWMSCVATSRCRIMTAHERVWVQQCMSSPQTDCCVTSKFSTAATACRPLSAIRYSRRPWGKLCALLGCWHRKR